MVICCGFTTQSEDKASVVVLSHRFISLANEGIKSALVCDRENSERLFNLVTKKNY